MKPNFTIIYSNKDPAGINISKELKKLDNKLKIIKFNKEIIYADNIDKKQAKDADFIIFASKHKSAKKIKTLSIHSPGNWNKAELGGKPEKICPASPFLNKLMFQILNQEAKENPNYEVTLECTHHGPYIEKPCIFIEIGSSKKQWKDEQAAKIISKTIIKTIYKFKSLDKNKQNKNWVAAVGVGGPHYCPNFNKIQLNSNYALGHIIPQYALPLNEEMIKQAIKKTIPKPIKAIIDWKGLGKSNQRQETIALLNKFGLKHLRTRKINKK